jgi:hypothetical protein
MARSMIRNPFLIPNNDSMRLIECVTINEKRKGDRLYKKKWYFCLIDEILLIEKMHPVDFM